MGLAAILNQLICLHIANFSLGTSTLLFPIAHLTLYSLDHVLGRPLQVCFQVFFRNKFCLILLTSILCVYLLVNLFRISQNSLIQIMKIIREMKLDDLETGRINRDYGHRGSAALTTQHPSIRKSWHYFR
jgi:hypothetical protein